ncbi:hypothetical protein ScPMuIL_016327 [Solemya velum]
MAGNLSIDLAVPFPSRSEAEIAHGSLSVDTEPKRGGGNKTMEVKDTVLNVHFEAPEARILRVSVNSFFEHLSLVVKTMEQFGPPRNRDGPVL